MRDSKDSQVWLQDIIESADLIELYLSDVDESKFFSSIEKQDSVIRRLGIIGEAIKNLPEDFKEQYPEISWNKAAGMRNVLIHEYFDVDLDIAWNTLKNDLPEFKKAVQQLLK
ncbi:MAG: DUF86 domain-containing protein [Patescibacteria group bacterium]